MYFLIYVSIAAKRYDGVELTEFLQDWRRKNEKLALTGMLLYKDGKFMQVLEGEEEKVKQLSAKIDRDPRHSNVTLLLQGHATERDFPDWSMGFSDLDAPQVASIAGYSEFMNTPLDEDAYATNPTRAQRLLRIFKRT
jgi:acylphosphatase